MSESSMDRREFLKSTAATGVALGAAGVVRGASPNNKVNVAVVGVHNRGADLAEHFARHKDAHVAYICDPDHRLLEDRAKRVARYQPSPPKTLGDFREVLDDKSIDALVIATPDHWHAPATIMGCAAGKHIYVEKPASHNPHEGRMMVDAAKDFDRLVQLGTQRRSSKSINQAIRKVHEGAIGTVNFARAWYSRDRSSIGHGHPSQPPEGLDWSLWQGPAPTRSFQHNLVHYNWHFIWRWGTGEIGNNGIHALDLCRWGLNVEAPTRVTCGGGMYNFHDDMQTPDTYVTSFDFGGGVGCMWESVSWNHYAFENAGFGAGFYGDQGKLITDGKNYKLYDDKGNMVEHVTGNRGELEHVDNFVRAVQGKAQLNAPIEIGQKSTYLCQTGNIAWRTGSTLYLDAEQGTIQHNPAAHDLVRRDYRKGWGPSTWR